AAKDLAGVDQDDAAAAAGDLLQLRHIRRLDPCRGEIEVDGGLELRDTLLLLAEPAIDQPRIVMKVRDLWRKLDRLEERRQRGFRVAGPGQHVAVIVVDD